MSSTNDRPTGRPRTIDPDAVSLVALRLFDDQGFDAVSMDDIAAAAGVSRRSLFRLFPNKAALVWGGLDEFAARFREALRSRPADEPSAVALRAAYRIGATFPDDAVEVTRHRLRVIRANPSLEHVGAATVTALTDEILRYVAERDGVTADDLAVAVRAHTLAAAASAALTWWALHGDGRPEDVLERALALLD
ncbi:TetR family transcriptional regulator [Curtobacterium flaccumfaciens pv. flaccumfaciens]|jgi:AcrR family transcriptional regulator|uniref:TetR family transcriptional regulator n=1 Tax=Curtobacterium TaxID=2034 RepID=UPI000DAAC6AF|nr:MULTISPECIES: TetR family transcriptional regulator [Curtobacterium]MBO9046580.1 TetR family transcriptional regulator [Curtobacterium flaccumfaciens pv. flaccumfaciens]MBO9056279.1 TetR family transcriptional regulator [Curtobacterium flaccumfaciens pv. flaccumfaciens]QTR91463.1 TetR family transcriptional regulator [Curtobacterium flaccumfaciens pv. flaccumfaciens]QVG66783.1 TetR family transcriptional regulator [Curtobacterium flaccumfaciens pv. flaccumfaciens]WIE58759.1 TetR family tran